MGCESSLSELRPLYPMNVQLLGFGVRGLPLKAFPLGNGIFKMSGIREKVYEYNALEL